MATTKVLQKLSDYKPYPKLYKRLLAVTGLVDDWFNDVEFDLNMYAEWYYNNKGHGDVDWEGTEFWRCVASKDFERAKALQPHLFEEESIVDSEGFIKWDGDDMPVDGDVAVDVKFRDGYVTSRNKAKCYYWDHVGEITDIVAYKLHTGDGYVNGVKEEPYGSPKSIIDAHNTVIGFDRPAPDLDAMVDASLKGLQDIADGKKEISFSLVMDVDDILSEFKSDLRKKLNLLVVDNIIDGDIVEKFDKLMREM